MPALIRSRLPPSLIQKPFHKWQMPRTGCLVQPYAKEKGCQTIGLALNKRGVDDAVAAGVDYVGSVFPSAKNIINAIPTVKRSILMYADFHSSILYCFSPLFLPVPIWDLCLL